MRIFKLLIVLLTINLSFAQDYFPKNDGVKQTFKNVVAVTNATVYTSSTTRIDKATILIKDDKILEIGAQIAIPKEATIIDATGKTIYPSFIDLYTEFGIQKPQAKPRNSRSPQYDSERNGYYWNDHIRADFNASDNLNYDDKTAKDLREIGFGTVLSFNNDGIVAGTGLLWTLNDAENNGTRILNKKISQHFTFRKSSLSAQAYPSSLMGSMALIRQLYHDAKWYAAGGSKTKDGSLEAFNQNKNLLQIFTAGDKLNILRADKIGDEFGVNYIIKGSGNELERIEELKKTNATLLIPINFPDAYDVSDSFLAEQVVLSDMKFWNQAPYNLKVLAENNINFALTTADLKNPKDFLANLRKAVELGFPKEKAIASLTEIPAKIANQNNVGSLKKGNLANFIIVSGDIFETKSTIQENWVQGNRFVIEKIQPSDIRGKYDLTLDNVKYDLSIDGEVSKLEAKISQDKLEFGTKLTYNEPWITMVVKSKDTLASKFIRISGLKSETSLSGKAILENGKEVSWSAIKKTTTSEVKKEEKKDEKKTPVFYPVTFPNMAFGNSSKPKQETILFKNATVWTGEKDGILKETDVLIENGKIVKIGKNLPQKGKVIDATGKHLTAGIIDEHSHIAISNGVNESGQNSSAEVTIEDVVNSEDINIYRNLAGGVTSANLLHGSANPIGGRAAFIKLKWGYNPDEMLVPSAPKYIKFALGENVKQSNWGDNERLRFPQSRMGVEQVYEDYFSRALAYQKEWDAYKASSKGKTPPRFDIELETLSQILNKKRFITCHSYVQSEINMLMKVAEKYNFKIQTFTHILEGYKLADKMAKHGVGGSTFADWWAYKYEVNDAIPYNAALMNNVGVTVSINSDDAEMSRRLNQEAGKTLKYGGVTEEQAWNFVTLNPAKLLQVDDKVGSIKIGKDADVVLWSDNPLTIYAKAEKTVVDGIIFFDIDQENSKNELVQKERNELINLMLDAKNKGLKTQEPKKKSTGHYHCDTLGEKCRVFHAKYNN
ncbi:amidohydrolase family protein [Flavobacterium urocaniciphilum]|uniref:Imidazolonepropionase n=1 Tax=Flavobacterium urocaniciphilum TaxID=1299341 RepID=A0A1H8YZB7_9FLAO|nr:amidohydrolase family protein [Flavobacterium urocaniciphilum]SEP57421.1 Imidazolonepropionase [Flavobacterium urocaniciphilum]